MGRNDQQRRCIVVDSCRTCRPLVGLCRGCALVVSPRWPGRSSAARGTGRCRGRLGRTRQPLQTLPAHPYGPVAVPKHGRCEHQRSASDAGPRPEVRHVVGVQARDCRRSPTSRIRRTARHLARWSALSPRAHWLSSPTQRARHVTFWLGAALAADSYCNASRAPDPGLGTARVRLVRGADMNSRTSAIVFSPANTLSPHHSRHGASTSAQELRPPGLPMNLGIRVEFERPLPQPYG